MTWEKAEADGLFGSTGSEQLRSFPNSTERILMYCKEIEKTGLQQVKLDMENFQSLRIYFKELQEHIGISLKKINEKLGHRKAEHAFYHSSTQWDLPTIETYNQLIKHFEIDKWSNYKKHETLIAEYESLRLEYEAERLKHEALRRPFYNFMKSTEILKVRFKPSEYDHETVKPEKLARLLIKTCSNENALVLVPFSGSGTECAMCAKEKRNFIGFDVTEKYVTMGNNRCNEVFKTPSLF